ncbi:flagellar basal body rod protein FlgC [Bacillus horti]|uniref:Flagellar basal-body rod protein FlgC n=1 Tax=Caldalkalibacillus horti TaxID=77523 RepID=A0ABT9VUK5_9BACI|nr:flagellar basal body rod protein FlgC [Bacillus horti]MDQ0164658.1 flagellar basal-body rod protein FlgC [Bacillus horti]
MSLFSALNNSASALTANRFRMDVISSNVANAQTTRARFVNGEWQPYQRKMVHIAPSGTKRFDSLLQKAMGKQDESSQGVKVTRIVEDQAPFKLVYDPDHPDANEEGYVSLPNVDIAKEMVDLMSATRSYDANVTVLNATKSMFVKALEIGKG